MTPAEEAETVAAAEVLCDRLIVVLLAHGCDGVSLALLGSYLSGLADASADAHQIAGTTGLTGHELVTLRPLVHAKAYERQLAYSAPAKGTT